LAELNVRRLERELVLAHETGAQVVVALTKADLAEDGQTERALEHVRHIVADGVRVLGISNQDPRSVEELRSCIPVGSVAVLIGRSGVGKSSLVNLLSGEEVQVTTPVREDGKGRHTTVNRCMVAVQGGGYIVDMPGVRGLGLWDADDGLAAAFPDIERLARECRFRDCTHTDEPGCAVKAAVEAGTVRIERLDSYVHLHTENEEQRRKREEAQRLATRGHKPDRHRTR
jgi:ribosome biogenesis GTPase